MTQSQSRSQEPGQLAPRPAGAGGPVDLHPAARLHRQHRQHFAGAARPDRLRRR